MKRLRHPIRAVREPFGTAGLIVAMIALVAALGGTALAANGALSGKQKKEVEKIAKKYAGKPGAAGANGTNGSNGTSGAPGGPGTAGEPGAKGKSVVAKAISTSSTTCAKQGGTEFEIEESGHAEKVCNGATGFTKTLPSGETETGTWNSPVLTEESAELQPRFFSPIPFAVPLAQGLTENEGCSEGVGRTEPCQVHFIDAAGEEILPGSGGEKVANPAGCQGSAGEPLAGRGNLCVYEGASAGVPALGGTETWEFLRILTPEGTLGESGVSPAGGTLSMIYLGAKPPTLAYIRGSWGLPAQLYPRDLRPAQGSPESRFPSDLELRAKEIVMAAATEHERPRDQMEYMRNTLAVVLLCASALLLLPAGALATQAHYYAGESFGGPSQLSLLTPGLESIAPRQIPSHQLKTPGSGLAVNDQTGEVYVADTGNHRISVFSATGAFLRTFGWGVENGAPEPQICTSDCQAGLPGSEPGQLDQPVFVAVDNSAGGEGDVYVFDEGDDVLTRFDAEGQLRAGWGDGGQLTAVPAAEGTGDLAPSKGEATGTFTRDSNLITNVQVSNGAFAVGQMFRPIDGQGIILKGIRGNPQRIVAIGPGTITLSEPFGDVNPSGGPLTGYSFVGEMTLVSNLTTGSGDFAPGRAVSGPGLPAQTRVLETSPGSMRLSGAVGEAKLGAALTSPAIPFGRFSGLDVGPEGDPYLIVQQDDILQISAAGTIVGLSTIGSANPAGLGLDGSKSLYFSDSFGQIEKLVPSGEREGVLSLADTGLDIAPTGLAVSRADSDVYVDVRGKAITAYRGDCLQSELITVAANSYCTPIQTFGEGPLDEGAGVAINTQSGTLYVASAGNDRIIAYPVAVEASAEAPSAVSAHIATLNGTVNPHGSELVSCSFEFGEGNAKGQSSVPCAESPGQIGAGSAPVAVHADLSGLEGGAHYEFRLRAINTRGDVKSDEEDLVTSPSPGVESAEATQITATSAVLEAHLNPRGSPTTYRFEYGPCATSSSCSTSPYQASVPVPDEAIGAGSTGVLASQPIEGLGPEVTYHFRVVATNSAGTTTGFEHTFTYLPAAPIEADCANEALRQSNHSTALPDCRAYELVTPAQKNGSLIGALFLGQIPPQVAADGSRITVPAVQCFAAPDSCIAHRLTEGEIYEFSRGTEGWQVTPLAPPAAGFPSHTWQSYGAEAGTTLFSSTEPSGSSPESFFTRRPDGSFRRIGPLGEGETDFGSLSTEAPYSTSDFSEVVYSTTAPVFSFDPGHGDSVYEYGETPGPLPQLVAVSGGAGSDDLISACGSRVAGKYNGLSADGRAVFFLASKCATGTGANAGIEVPAAALYQRIDGERTAPVSAAVPSSCTGECEGTPPAGVTFEGASRDGSLAYFTSTQQLTDEASEDREPGDRTSDCTTAPPNASGCNLYLSICPQHCQNPSQRKLIDVSAGAKLSGGPKVQGMVALSADGSQAYFVARGVLVETPNAKGERAVEEAPNLYLYQRDEAHPEGRLSFVARLAPTDTQAERPEIGTANLTPDGRYLLLTSHRALTADASSGAAQVYRYDSANETMTRVSIGQRGFNDDGNAGSQDATIPLPFLQYTLGDGPAKPNISISDDGRYAFFQSPVALTPQALNEVKVISSPEEFAENVYEWEEDGVGGCHDASGCVSLLSDGNEAFQGGVVAIRTPELLGSDASGENVFIAAGDQLTWQDGDTQRDYYDLRVGGGFAPPSEPLPCQGDACKGQASEPPAESSPASAVFSGPEEGPKHPQKPKTKGQKKKGHKKKKSKHRKTHKKHHRTHKHRDAGSKRVTARMTDASEGGQR